MLSGRASEHWKRFGESDPYYGVLSDPRFRGKQIDAATRDRFFASGARHVDLAMKVIDQTLGNVSRRRALDFGCGVGRITQALAPLFENVVGLDVAPGMLAEARCNAAGAGLSNIDYYDSTDTSHLRPLSYDLVHSFIVLQHIPVAIGEPIIRQLVDSVAEGGVCALHLTIRPPERARRTALRNAIKRNSVTRIASNLMLGRRWNEPAMEMNLYRMERIVEILAASGIHRFSCVRVDDWGSLGIFLLFRRMAGEEGKSPWSNPVR